MASVSSTREAPRCGFRAEATALAALSGFVMSILAFSWQRVGRLFGRRRRVGGLPGEGAGQGRQHLLPIADDADVRLAEDRRVRIAVDGEHRPGLADSDHVIGGATDADADVELRPNG